MNFIQLLSDAVRFNIVGENAYRTRFIGFKSEMYFENYLIDKGKVFYKGGFMIPIYKDRRPYEDFVYYTVLNNCDDLDLYVCIYKQVSKLKYSRLFIIRYDELNSNSEVLEVDGKLFPTPTFELFEFKDDCFVYLDNSLAKFVNCFSSSHKNIDYVTITDSQIKESFIGLSINIDLHYRDIYVNRLIFDVILGSKIMKGIPLDIDFIIRGRELDFLFAEIKEKNLAKSIKGFGLDEKRIQTMEIIEKDTGVPFFLFVREVNDQKTRIFKNWWFISIDRFRRNMNNEPIEGGYGMRGIESSNPTYICPLKFFTKLS